MGPRLGIPADEQQSRVAKWEGRLELRLSREQRRGAENLGLVGENLDAPPCRTLETGAEPGGAEGLFVQRCRAANLAANLAADSHAPPPRLKFSQLARRKRAKGRANGLESLKPRNKRNPAGRRWENTEKLNKFPCDHELAGAAAAAAAAAAGQKKERKKVGRRATP